MGDTRTLPTATYRDAAGKRHEVIVVAVEAVGRSPTFAAKSVR